MVAVVVVEVFAYRDRVRKVRKLERMMERLAPMEECKVTTWTCQGSEITVKTPKEGNESNEQHCNRHDATVKQLQQACPPD